MANNQTPGISGCYITATFIVSMDTIVFGLATLGVLFIITFLVMAPAWQSLLAFLPLFVYAFFFTPTDSKPIYLLLIIPLLVIDIQVLDKRWKFKRLWKYVAWLPGAALFVMYSINFRRVHFSDNLDIDILIFVASGVCIVILGKFWLGNPLCFFLNRLRVKRMEMVTYQIATLEMKISGRGLSFFLVPEDRSKVEISGFVFAYLKKRGFKNGGTAVFEFKTGSLDIKFATGYPKVFPRTETIGMV